MDKTILYASLFGHEYVYCAHLIQTGAKRGCEPSKRRDSVSSAKAVTRRAHAPECFLGAREFRLPCFERDWKLNKKKSAKKNLSFKLSDKISTYSSIKLIYCKSVCVLFFHCFCFLRFLNLFLYNWTIRNRKEYRAWSQIKVCDIYKSI